MWIRNTFRDFRSWFNDKYWHPLKYRTTHRYHILDLRDGGNDYDIGWHDSDSQILQANFLILKNFVEKEEPFKIIDWEWNEETKAAAQEIKTLYKWWTEDRAKEQAELAQAWANIKVSWKFEPQENGLSRFVWTGGDTDAVHQKEHELYEKDTEMLIRLIEIRKSLWT